jgi:hypothetical protein
MHDIVVRFPSKEMADYFCGQMSDGYGEGFCDFISWRQKEGTDGKKSEDYERISEQGKDVYFVNRVEDFDV